MVIVHVLAHGRVVLVEVPDSRLETLVQLNSRMYARLRLLARPLRRLPVQREPRVEAPPPASELEELHSSTSSPLPRSS